MSYLQLRWITPSQSRVSKSHLKSSWLEWTIFNKVELKLNLSHQESYKVTEWWLESFTASKKHSDSSKVTRGQLKSFTVSMVDTKSPYSRKESPKVSKGWLELLTVNRVIPIWPFKINFDQLINKLDAIKGNFLLILYTANILAVVTTVDVCVTFPVAVWEYSELLMIVPCQWRYQIQNTDIKSNCKCILLPLSQTSDCTSCF